MSKGSAARPARADRPRFDFRPNKPDLSAFPRQEWGRCLRTAALELPTPDLDYGDMRGLARLREALADYLDRVRGVAADPDHLVITSGFAQGRNLICQALAIAGYAASRSKTPVTPSSGPR